MSETPDFSELRWMPGVRVVHPEFGAGVIRVLSRKQGGLHMATVQFDNGRRETFEISGLARERPGPYG